VVYGFGGKHKLGPFCPGCAADAKKNNEMEDAIEKRRRIAEAIVKSGIPKRFLACSLDNYQPGYNMGASLALKVARKYAEGFEDRRAAGGSLVFCGLPGTGKTHLACAIGNQLLQQSVSVKYATVFAALSNVKSTFSKNSERTERQAIGEYQNAQLLILDEVGVQFGSETEKIILYQITNGRYENMLPTIMISNLPEKELAEYIGERCLDRMREGGGAVVSFDWQSYRK